MTVDYIIVGQGISGSFLSYFLQAAGAKIIVVDRKPGHTASRIASGVINPVTGRRIVKTWMIDALIPFARKAYGEMEQTLGRKFLHDCNVLEFHPSLQMQQAFADRLKEPEHDYLHTGDIASWEDRFRFHFGLGVVAPAFWADLTLMLTGWRQYLADNGLLKEENFDCAACQPSASGVIYKDIRARKVFFCDGVGALQNPWFRNLPFALNKGEAIIASIPGLPHTHIYKQGLSIVPWQQQADLFWIGSTYTWNYDNLEPTAAFRQKVTTQLDQWLKLPYTLLDHFAAERPANVERRPFVGLHPRYASIGILNGMGSKGCSLAPYFAHQLTQHLSQGTALEPLADVRRFRDILLRDSTGE